MMRQLTQNYQTVKAKCPGIDIDVLNTLAIEFQCDLFCFQQM